MERDTTITAKCFCSGSDAASYQDSVYGPGMRVHTPINKNRGSKATGLQHRCTVCGKEK